MIHLDSDLCIDVLRHRPKALSFLAALPAREIAVSTVVRAELYVGANQSKDAARGLWKIDELLSPFEDVPFDTAAAFHYGTIRAAMESMGNLIGRNDLLIAATALAHGATLITRNVREFERVPGLRVKSWEA